MPLVCVCNVLVLDCGVRVCGRVCEFVQGSTSLHACAAFEQGGVCGTQHVLVHARVLQLERRTTYRDNIMHAVPPSIYDEGASSDGCAVQRLCVIAFL